MRILIDNNVLENGKWFPILDIIAMQVEEGRHSYDPAFALNLIASSWGKHAGVDTIDLIRLQALSNSTDPDADASLIAINEIHPRGGVSDHNGFTTKIHPLDSILFLSTPFQVILENEVFDGAFLLWMAKALNYSKFISAYRNGRFVFRHAGGKGSIERSANAFCNGVWGRKDGKHFRAFRMWMCAVLDNDAKSPGDTPNKSIVDATNEEVVFVHELNKRSIETYIPFDFLQRLMPSIARRKIYALKRLTEVQRKHYHMKKGFRVENDTAPTLSKYLSSPKISKREKELFGTIPFSDWQDLRDGFGSSLSKIFVEEQYRPNSNDERFTNKQDRAELLTLLKKIYERL